MFSFDTMVFGNTVEKWLIALLSTVLVFFIFTLTRHLLLKRFRKVVARTSSKIDDILFVALENTRPYTILTFAAFLSTIHVDLEGRFGQILSKFFVVLFAVQVA